MSVEYMVENIFKSGDEVLNRIFNHKPFLEAEVRCMLKEFEDEPQRTCRGRPHEQLLETANERIHNMQVNQVNGIEKGIDRLESLNDSVNKVEEMMQRLLALEAEKETERKRDIDLFRAQQNESLVEFMQKMDQRINDIDSLYESAREDIRLKYTTSEAKPR